MLRSDRTIIDFCDVYTSVQFSPVAVQQIRSIFQRFFECIQIVLEVCGAAIFIGLLSQFLYFFLFQLIFHIITDHIVSVHWDEVKKTQLNLF